MAATLTSNREHLGITTNPWTNDARGERIDLEPGYRIGVYGHDPDHLPMLRSRRDDFRFARQIDAEMAIEALKREGLDTVEKLKAAGWEKVKQVMASALQW